MTPDPKQLARLLLGSTLSDEEQQAVIAMLPQFSLDQIGELVEVLEKDHRDQAKYFAQAESKRDQAILQMNVGLSKVKIEDMQKKS